HYKEYPLYCPRSTFLVGSSIHNVVFLNRGGSMHRSVPSCFILILAGLFVIPAATLSSPPILPPTISPIANQVTQRDSILGPIAFTVGDPLISPDSLTLSGSSSDTILIPIPNITFGGGGANRTVTIAPGLHKTG